MNRSALEVTLYHDSHGVDGGGSFASPGLNQTNFLGSLYDAKRHPLFPKIKSDPKVDIQDGRQDGL